MSTPYLIPAPYTGISTYRAHTKRNPPSSEPGVDYYMPTGTPLRAPARCRVVEVGGSVYPATGRFVTVDDGTRWLRFLHLSEWKCRVGDELDQGEVFALSGASGYGSDFFGEPSRNDAFWRNTGGDHVHVTAFAGRYYDFGRDGTGSVDFHALTGGKIAGESTPTTAEEEEQEMYIANVKNGNFYLVIGKEAHALGAGSDARQSGIPILNYVDDWAVKQLKKVVSGIGSH